MWLQQRMAVFFFMSRAGMFFWLHKKKTFAPLTAHPCLPKTLLRIPLLQLFSLMPNHHLPSPGGLAPSPSLLRVNSLHWQRVAIERSQSSSGALISSVNQARESKWGSGYHLTKRLYNAVTLTYFLLAHFCARRNCDNHFEGEEKKKKL